MSGSSENTSSNGWGERTSSDLSSLLVELTRLLKGVRFFNRTHPKRGELLSRAFMAWQGEIQRAGAVDLWLESTGIRCAGVRESVGRGHLDGLLQDLKEHAIESLRLGPDLDQRSFETLVNLLSNSPTTVAERGGIAAALVDANARGVSINGVGDEPADQPLDRQLNHPPPRPQAPASLVAGPAASLASGLLGSRAASRAFEPCDSESPKPSLEEQPLETPGDAGGEELRRVLAALDETDDDDSHETLAETAVRLAARLSDEGHLDEGYRALLILSDQAVGAGGRSGTQARCAQASLEELASGVRLDDLIDRACSTQGSVGVRPAQVLLQLGERALPRLVDRLELERQPDRLAQLGAVVIAMGDRALGELIDMISEGSPARARIALRLAGELQNPAVVPTLLDVLRGGRPELRSEAARALVHFGGADAIEALGECLSHPEEELALAAAASLRELADPIATDTLLSGLEEARNARRNRLVRDIVDALGETGSVEAVPRLASLLGQRGGWPGRHREVKLAVVAALAKLPGREAERALVRAGAGGSRAVRDAARNAVAAKGAHMGSIRTAPHRRAR